jgi:uncharacterized membrane protein (DUF4010 family)
LSAIQPPAPGQRSLSRGRWLGWAVAGLILIGCFLVVRPRDVVEALGRLSAQELAVLLLIATLMVVLAPPVPGGEMIRAHLVAR